MRQSQMSNKTATVFMMMMMQSVLLSSRHPDFSHGPIEWHIKEDYSSHITLKLHQHV